MSTPGGAAGGAGTGNPGGNAEIAVVNFAVHDAPAELVAPAGVQVTDAPRLLPLFRNCTVPDGPIAELLFEVTVAVSVTLVPDVMLTALDVTVVVVVACVMVTERVLLALAGL